MVCRLCNAIAYGEKRKIESHRKTNSSIRKLYAQNRKKQLDEKKSSSQRVLNLKTGFRLFFCLFGHLSDHRCILFNPCLFLYDTFSRMSLQSVCIPVVNWCFFRIVCHSHWTHLRWNTKKKQHQLHGSPINDHTFLHRRRDYLRLRFR